jgi:transposase
LDLIVERCAGLDVHRDTVVATVRVPGKGKSRRRRAQQTRTFATTIAQLEQLGDWLDGFGVTRVGIESTGCCWKPVFSMLERRFECWLINAQHLRNVPGRKSDVIDSRWCCELVELGLVRPSFVPPPEIRRLRDLTRQRSIEVQERSRTIQRLEKVLQDAGIKLTSVASKTYSVSARAMLEALLGGVSDPVVLAQLARGRLRTKIPQLEEALANRFEITHHGVLVAGLLAHIDALDQAIATLEARITLVTEPYADLIELLCTIPGIGVVVAQILIAECGVDMSIFPSVGHFVSWAAICPGTNQSGRKRRSGKTRRGDSWLRSALTEAAHGAARTKHSYLSSHYWQLRGRRGEPNAIGATRHDILIAYHHIVRDRVPYRELGPDRLARRHSPRAPHPQTRQTTRSTRPQGHTRGRRLSS